MKFLEYGKDGGPESSVWAYTVIEIKSLFSMILLNFRGKSRDAMHNHAFGAISWLLRGELYETEINGRTRTYRPSVIPIYTPKVRFHRVDASENAWVLSFRGPWRRFWREYVGGRVITLKSGRINVGEEI